MGANEDLANKKPVLKKIGLRLAGVNKVVMSWDSENERISLEIFADEQSVIWGPDFWLLRDFAADGKTVKFDNLAECIKSFLEQLRGKVSDSRFEMWVVDFPFYVWFWSQLDVGDVGNEETPAFFGLSQHLDNILSSWHMAQFLLKENNSRLEFVLFNGQGEICSDFAVRCNSWFEANYCVQAATRLLLGLSQCKARQIEPNPKSKNVWLFEAMREDSKSSV